MCMFCCLFSELSDLRAIKFEVTGISHITDN